MSHVSETYITCERSFAVSVLCDKVLQAQFQDCWDCSVRIHVAILDTCGLCFFMTISCPHRFNCPMRGNTRIVTKNKSLWTPYCISKSSWPKGASRLLHYHVWYTKCYAIIFSIDTLWSNHLFPIKTPSGNRRVPYFNQVRIDFGNFFSWVVKTRFHVSWFLRVSFHVGRFFHL
jgi:hypothetical protein